METIKINLTLYYFIEMKYYIKVYPKKDSSFFKFYYLNDDVSMFYKFFEL